MVNFSVVPPGPHLKRKPGSDGMGGHALKRRRDTDEGGGVGGDGFDGENGGQGAKHWTDEEKTKLFEWLMAPGQDEHWNALRATKNSCLREVWALESLSGAVERSSYLSAVRSGSIRQQEDLPGAQRVL
jgi:hypothetical protein